MTDLGTTRPGAHEASAPGFGRDEETIFVADWLSGLFIAPLDEGAIEAYRSGPAAALLFEIAEAFGCPEAGRRLDAVLASGEAHAVAGELSRQYTRLFDGLGGPQTIALYESATRGGHRLFQEPFAEMQAVLRHLDVAVGQACPEPADHLSIELAAFAAAMRQGDGVMAAALAQRLNGWVPPLAEAIAKADPEGFYGAAGLILAGFLRTLSCH
ncbi:TorD/DmsD family molecular chaperone [Afifella marina]|uniref:TorA specific chaperone n=1 Tax=Afifella marina DSM 2698 TaxID=1120955 RepID=A0A1G5P797_AFIMA|nr:molecular chaperone TorD family protein [Afifella marina]MBK1624827.1 hypothetical protein [Afifella marina DSM 2698]MBK1628421.1 hypothetical protein [Afifella marina]MBK5917908.1 hypothetical protein [Afifella marina]RAI18751.1 hypothetical protein CH311_14880 [Afifella marina DSM 2698]SCZ45158.1 TorA specific chaperone [Afifella marina DSM 2698]